MYQFWLGTWAVEPPIVPSDLAAEPLAREGLRALAVEVIWADDDVVAVLFSAVDDTAAPRKLACRIGFTNGTKACRAWRARGFPLVDATIEYEPKKMELRVSFPHYAESRAMRYDGLHFRIRGIAFQKMPSAAEEGNPGYQKLDGVAESLASDGAAAAAEDLVTYYDQLLEAPDPAYPSTAILQRGVAWKPQRSSVEKLSSPSLDLEITDSRSPSLRPLRTASLRPANAWWGHIDRPPPDSEELAERPKRASRADIFGEPNFRFEDVEVVGFRLDLDDSPELDAGLARLIAPLNFHLQRRRRLAEFRYAVASRMILIELLRYGRMQLRNQPPPLTPLDYQSQHELVVRVLVGRVNDDAAQAQDAAVYVPAIFVDNPWSKILGRDVQGFDKRMAQFCCIEEPSNCIALRPDGTVPGSDRRRNLTDIVHIRLPQRISESDLKASRLMDLNYITSEQPDGDDFRDVDLDLAYSDISGTRWRQADFDQPEFRRSFAIAAIPETTRGFRSIQASPLGNRHLLPAWIMSTFTIDEGLRVAYPTGGAELTLWDDPDAPPAWRQLCQLLEVDHEGAARRIFQTGSWYRLRFSMSMVVNDGLEWGD